MHAFTQADALIVQVGKAEAGVDVTSFLLRDLRLPEAYVQQLLKSDRVRIGKQRINAETCLQAGQVLRLQGDVLRTHSVTFNTHSEVTPDEVADCHDKFYGSLDILYEDAHLLVVNKPPGVLIHSDGTMADVHTLLETVNRYYDDLNEPFAVRHIHRLDRPTTGTVLFAKHGYSARALDAELVQRKISRKYLAIVYGKQVMKKKGIINQRIGRDRHQSGRYRVAETGKPAVTHYETIRSVRWNGGYLSLVRCELATGRTHQIRVHMTSMGCPVIGDILYSGEELCEVSHLGIGSEQIALHAESLTFVHPYEQETISVVAPIPKNWYIFSQGTGLRLL